MQVVFTLKIYLLLYFLLNKYIYVHLINYVAYVLTRSLTKFKDPNLDFSLIAIDLLNDFLIFV